MAKKQPKNNEYRLKNEAFIQALRDGKEELLEISQGVLVKILKSGDGDRCPRAGNVVTVNYKGSFINGKVSEDVVRKLLGIPEHYAVQSIVAIGHKAREAKPFDEDNMQWDKVHIGCFGGEE